MWKCFSRTFRESIERRPYFARPDTTGQDTTQTCMFQTLTQNCGKTTEEYEPDGQVRNGCPWKNEEWPSKRGTPQRKHEKTRDSGLGGYTKQTWEHFLAVDKHGSVTFISSPKRGFCWRKHEIKAHTVRDGPNEIHEHSWLHAWGWGNGFNLNCQPKREECHWRKHHKKGHHEKWKSGPHIDHHQTWLGAVGWSSFLVLGWYMIQPLYHLRILPGDKEKPHGTSYVSLLNVLSKTVLAEPSSKQSATFTSDTLLKQVEKLTTDDCDGSITQAEVTSSTFGPLTAEEALDEATENFIKVQNSLCGDIDNHLGVEYMKLGKHKQAFAHFTKAMEVKHGPAAYNLGLCCEMGLGTEQNFKEAAKHYQIAADEGHATAMYNLGVFHIHGWGGLPADCNRAQELFEKASQMGQSDAKKALEMTRSPLQSPSNSNKLPEPTQPTNLGATEVLLQALGIVNNTPSSKTSHSVEIPQQCITTTDIESVHDDFIPGKTLNENPDYENKYISQLMKNAIFKYTSIIQKY